MKKFFERYYLVILPFIFFAAAMYNWQLIAFLMTEPEDLFNILGILDLAISAALLIESVRWYFPRLMKKLKPESSGDSK